METYQGFKIVKMKFSESSEETCEIFWKPHSIREYDMKKPGGRTLFIINIPSYITKESLQQIMQKFGKVKEVFLHKKPNSKAPPDIKYPLLEPEVLPEGYKVGYVVFTSSKSIRKALNFSPKKTLIASRKKCPIATGMKKWYDNYNSSFKCENDLKKEVELIMTNYDAEKAKQKASTDPDDEGWITVSSTTKKRRSKLETSGKPSRRRRRTKTKLLNFYDFHRKQVNLKHLEEKKKKFEEDGRRMALLRSSRKFKPL